MSVNILGKFTLLISAVFLFVGFTAFAQPQKTPRGVTAKPSPSTTQTTSANIPPTPKKKVVIVLDFQDNTLGSVSEKRDWGRQIAALLSTKFSESGNFLVVEQQEKEQAIIKMQNNTQTNRKDRSYQAQIGQLVSANIVVFGDILEYTTKKEGTSVMGIGQSSFSAKVRLAVRLVDVNTGIALDATTVLGTADSKDKSFGVYGKATDANSDLKTALFTEAVNQATQNAVGVLIKLIDKPINTSTTDQPGTAPAPPASANTLAETPEKKDEKKCGGGFLGIGKKCKEETATPTLTKSNPPVVAPVSTLPRIAAIDGQDVFVKNLPAGTSVGTKLIVYQIGKVIKDAETGEIIKQEEIKLAELEVVSIAGSSFVCKILSGSGVTEKSLIKIAK